MTRQTDMPKGSFTQTQHQQQALTQTLSPLQLLAVQLLEMTTVEIEERVRGEVMDNPALEPLEREDSPADDDAGTVSDEFLPDEFDDYSGNGDIPVAVGRFSGAEIAGEALSFGDTLMEQLGELTLTPVERAVGEYIIGSLDEDGILRKPLGEIEDELLVYDSIDADEPLIADVLARIQTFEPAGIAARSLQECLLL